MNSTDAFNPLTPMSDQDRTSPYNINTISSRQVMRIKKNISQGIVSWSNTNSPNQHHKSCIADNNEKQTVRRISNEILGVKELNKVSLYLKTQWPND